MELHFRVGEVQLAESWIRRVQWGGSGSLPGKPFLIWLHPLRCSSKDLSGEKKQAYPLPQANRATGPSHFLPLMGLCIRPRGVGLQACFAQGVCLWVTLNYHHNSKHCTYLLPAWLKSWGIVNNFCLPNYLRSQTSRVSTESRVMCIPQSEAVPGPGIKWGREEVRPNSSNLPTWTKTLKKLHTFPGLRNVPNLVMEM